MGDRPATGGERGTPVVALPVTHADGAALLAFDRVPEDDTTPRPSVTASLVVLGRGDLCLLVFNRFRQVWELPGGMLDPGETPREAAFRELAEESGQRPETLDFVGFARCEVAPGGRPESLAIYRGSVDSVRSFEPNDEIARITWWHPADELERLAPIDAALARLCDSTSGRGPRP